MTSLLCMYLLDFYGSFSSKFCLLAWVRNWIVLVRLKGPFTKKTPSLSSPVCISRCLVLQLVCDLHKGLAENSEGS